MPRRPRHPKKALEDLLKEAEANDWTVTKGRGYYKAKCPCGACLEMVHLSPSDPNYVQNKRNKISKCPEWKEKS